MGVKSIFIDTNYFCGLYNLRDSLHSKSREIYEGLKKEKHRLLISNYIIAETLTVLSQGAGKEASLKFGRDIFGQNNLIAILIADLKTDLKSFEIFKKVRSKNFSFVDALILALMKKFKIDYLLTFDKRLIRVAKRFGVGIL